MTSSRAQPIEQAEPARTASPATPVVQPPPPRDTRQYEDLLASRLASREPAPVRPSTARSTTPPSRAQSVDISVKGPTIGTAPYYLAYGIDLPADVVSGADFLWKDNGVWMGDEPYGVKILEAPGVHRITVLIITRDNVEYRGMTTVRVLDRAASADLGERRRSTQ